MTAKKPKSEHKPIGRPRTIPPGARNRSIRCTDAEYAELMKRLAELRASGNSAT